MKRYSISLTALFAVLLTFLVQPLPVSHATALRRHATEVKSIKDIPQTSHNELAPWTSSGGTRSQNWQGGMYGATAIVQVSNPNLTDCGTTCGTWDRTLQIETSDRTQQAVVGFEKNSTSVNGVFCHNSGLFAFLDYNGYSVCYSLNINDVNKLCTLEVYDFSSTHVAYVIQCASSAPCPGVSPCQLSEAIPAWYYITLAESFDQTFTGELVWGVSWVANQYMHQDFTWHYQLSAGGQAGGIPPQMYWADPPKPDGSNKGGTLYSCIYQNTNNACVLNH